MKIRFFVIVSAVAITSIGLASVAWRTLYRTRYRISSLNPSIEELSHWWARLEIFGALIFAILLTVAIMTFRKFLDLRGMIVIGCTLFASCAALTSYQILSDPVAELELKGIGLSKLPSALGVIASILWICFFLVLILTVDEISKQKKLHRE